VAERLKIDEIKNIVEFLAKSGVTEFKLERGDEKLSLKRGEEAPSKAPQNVVGLVSPFMGQSAPVVSAQPTEPIPAPANTPPSEADNDDEKSSWHEVNSPVVGTFYRRSSPDAEPFVEVGDWVSKGQVIAIVEAMKVMNEIESDCTGRVKEVCLDDAQMTEYDEVLFRIDPNG
jgi:acetyl-CoA carboxylase biotin carboxyl carrier protein